MLFTAPWEPVVVRRGDALGLRGFADQFAEALAPDLSNRTNDGRWVTILAWCLVRSHDVFCESGRRSILSRTEQSERYAWLRPLELMWIARTIALAEGGKDRPLPGKRRVQPWYEIDEQRTDRFGMSSDQFRAYRQTGMYGGYRLAFRKWPGMTVNGDGWTPSGATIKLAKWLDANLGAAGPSWKLDRDHDGPSFPVPNSRSDGKEHEWWLRNWKTYQERGRDAEQRTLPRRRDDHAVLPKGEIEHLKPLIFGDDPSGKRRLKVAGEIAKASAASHIEVCERLGKVLRDDDPIIGLLPRFSRLADAGMDAMELIAKELRKGSHVALADIASSSKASLICEKLADAANDWRNVSEMQFHNIETADSFARAFTSSKPKECLRALLEHHEIQGGGLRWFVLRNGKIEPRTPTGGLSSRYRFRLWSLCRLAAQCGVINGMPTALREEVEEDKEDADE